MISIDVYWLKPNNMITTNYQEYEGGATGFLRSGGGGVPSQEKKG
jgi:hypothetical protein